MDNRKDANLRFSIGGQKGAAASGVSRALTINLLIISGAHMATHVFGRIHPALFPVFRDEFQLSLQQLGLIASVPALIQAVLYIPSGLLADRIGAKTLIILSFLISGVSAVAMGFTFNVAMLIVSLSILNSAITLYHPPSYSLTSELFPREKRGRALGVHGAGGTLGMALGPLSLSLFVGYLLWDWRAIYLFWSLPMLLYILAIWWLKPHETSISKLEFASEEKEDRSPGARSVLTLGVVVFMVFQAMRTMGDQILGTFIPTYIHDQLGLTVAEASFIYGASSLAGVAAASIGGYLADRLGDKRWLILAMFLQDILLILAALSFNVTLFTLLYWSSGFFGSSGMGASSSIISRSTPRARRGLGFALYFLPGSVVSIISPIIGAYIAGAFGIWSIFPAAVAVSMTSLVLLKFLVS